MARDATNLCLNNPDVLRRYDTRSIERGLRYAAEGRVNVIDVGPDWATAEVAGNAATPYKVHIDWAGLPQRYGLSDHCSCPLGGDCKHAVALIVEISRMGSTTLGDVPTQRPFGGHSSSRAPQPPTRPAAPARRAAPARPAAWRAALSEVAVSDAVGAQPLALQFTYQAPVPMRYMTNREAQLLVRPVRMGAKGKWVKSGAGWREITNGYGWELTDADPTHVAAIRGVGAGNNALAYSSNNGPVLLDRLGPAAWASLRAAVDAGVALIDEHGQEVVTLSDNAAPTVVDLTAGPDGSIQLQVGISVDGNLVDLSTTTTGLIGTPPHGLFLCNGERIELVQLERPVPASLAKLMAAPPLLVPAGDVEELIDHYQPQLAKLASVGSSDGSVTIEETHLDGLVAQIDRHAVASARLSWLARYRRGERVTLHPIASPGGLGRDRRGEQALMDSLALPVDLLAELTGPNGQPADISVTGHDAVVLLTQVVPQLTEQGQVSVEINGDAPQLRESIGDPLIALNVSEPDDTDGATDWFDLSVEVSVDGERVPFAELFSALARDEPVLVLRTGTWLRLDRPELARLRELIAEARGLIGDDGDDNAEGLRVNRFQVSWWDELASLGVVEQQSQRWSDSVARMRELSAPEPVAPSPRLAATLRGYQQEGLDWLAFLHRNQLGGILADDMGLGKTVQTLALFLHVLEQDPDARFLVVAPTSVVENWHREAERFAPDVAVATIHGTAARRGGDLAATIGDARIVVTSYALFRLEFDDYQSIGWELLVLDEAQFVKNHRSKTYQCVRRLHAQTKLAITGTPMENSVMDLWSLLSITAPGLYPDPQRFTEVYRRPIESGRSPETLSTLRRRIAPLMRRRTKGDVLTELPPKTEQVVEIDLSPRHTRIYQSQLQLQRQKVLGLVGDIEQHRFEILKSLTILRQLSLDPALVDADHEGVGSAKLDRLVDDLTQVVAEGHRALVFSQFTRYLTRVKARLDDAGIGYAYLDGRTRRRDRAISRFKDGDAPVFVISLKAGGFGLNLTEADYCFVLDPWWNPAAETQAIDRAHRIGQQNPVMVYRYVAAGTIEEKVMELKARKSALFDSVIDADGALAGALGEQEIRSLIDLAS